MESTTKNSHSIDEYIASFPLEIQERLTLMRQTIHNAAPDAVEKISYKMPTFYLNGNLVHFAAFKNHIGFYPTPSGISAFSSELEGYVNAKGSVQFPHSLPLPLDLIHRIVLLRVQENMKKNRKS